LLALIVRCLGDAAESGRDLRAELLELAIKYLAGERERPF
jgi:hypothetical protein